MTYADEHPGHGFGQTQIRDWVKPINGLLFAKIKTYVVFFIHIEGCESRRWTFQLSCFQLFFLHIN
jgi:hypothetical protein